MIPPPPRSPLFPYTTLFRSAATQARPKSTDLMDGSIPPPGFQADLVRVSFARNDRNPARRASYPLEDHDHDQRHEARRLFDRSEEHTSELQSRLHLVCRLLL